MPSINLKGFLDDLISRRFLLHGAFPGGERHDKDVSQLHEQTGFSVTFKQSQGIKETWRGIAM